MDFFDLEQLFEVEDESSILSPDPPDPSPNERSLSRPISGRRACKGRRAWHGRFKGRLPFSGQGIPGKKIDTMLLLLEQRHNTCRQLINKISRRRVRKLNLLNLPDEVLRQICGYLGPDDGPRSVWFFPEFHHFNGTRRTIANIRLTCRRLYEASSHLFLNEALILLEPTSISETQTISTHPFISKGIQCLNVNLDYYPPDLADLPAFAHQVLSVFGETLNYHSRTVEPGIWKDSRLHGCSRRELARAVKKGERLYLEWERLIGSLQVLQAGSAEMQVFIEESVLESKAFAGLIRAHERHKECWRFQEGLLRDDALVHTVIDTLHKMPTARRAHIGTGNNLSFQFRKHSHWESPDTKPFHESVDYPSSIAAHNGVKRRDWGESGTDATWNESPPAKICLELISRIFDNSKLFVDHLSLTVPIFPLLGYMTEEQLQVIRKSTRHMRVFEFDGARVETPDELKIFQNADRMRKATDFLMACMGGPCLKRLSLRAPRLNQQAGHPEIGMGRVLCQTRFPELENVSINYFHIHLHELKHLLQSLEKEKVTIWLKHVTLLSGTWEEAIDMLKAKSGSGSSVEDIYGAECDDLTEEEKAAFFAESFSVEYARDQRRRENREPLGRPVWAKPEHRITAVNMYIRPSVGWGVGVIENPFTLRARCLGATETVS